MPLPLQESLPAPGVASRENRAQKYGLGNRYYKQENLSKTAPYLVRVSEAIIRESEAVDRLLTEIDPVQVLLHTAGILEGAGRFERAARYYEGVFEFDPDNAVAREGLSRVTKKEIAPFH